MPTADHYNVRSKDRVLRICAFRNPSSSVVKLDLTEEFQTLDKDGWFTVAGGAINRPVSKSQILQPWSGDRHASVLFRFMTVAVCPYELKTNTPQMKNISIGVTFVLVITLIPLHSAVFKITVISTLL